MDNPNRYKKLGITTESGKLALDEMLSSFDIMSEVEEAIQAKEIRELHEMMDLPHNSHDKLVKRGLETIIGIIGEDNETLEDGITPNVVLFSPSMFAVKENPDE